MNLSDAGLSLITKSEGYLTRLPDGGCTAYLCPAGVVTIGFGCTEGVKMGDVWTREKAEQALRAELGKHEAAVRRLVTVDMTQGQFDALVSFSYNVGSGALGGSTLLKKLNRGDHAGACKEFAKWDKARVKGKMRPLRGLTIRRANEAALFASRDEPAVIAQKVEVPVEPVKALPAAAVATTAVTAVTQLPALVSPPTAILETATAWRGFSTQVLEFSAFAISSPKSIAVIVVAGLAVWFGPRFAPKLFGGS